jgi:nicotinamidase-related amidase
MSTALLIVDMMNDHVHPDGAAARYLGSGLTGAQRVRLLANARRLLHATRAAGRPVVHVRNEYRWDGLDCGTTEARLRQRPLPPGVPNKIAGTWGAQIIDDLAPAADEPVLVKKNQSAFWFTPLDLLLRRLGVQTCITLGGAAGGCLNDTVREGVGYGYEFLVLSDAVYPVGSPVLDSLAERADLLTTDEALALLDAAPAASLAGSAD